ncbi:MAG: histidine phosphatase family protein [Sphingobacteriia bacterium]|jgi:phosphohistidine phosphatase
MKQLLLVRHAKSSWANIGQDDFDRPLNDRGLKDAPSMANRIKLKGIQVDQFISSTALRAITTARFFAVAYDQKPTQIFQLKQLYHAAPAVYYQVIEQIDDSINTAAIFAHNPGITDFINELDLNYVPNMPTCGVFAINIETNHWADFNQSKKAYWFFDYPKLQ